MKDAAEAWVSPEADSATRSISLVLVLPTLPVTPMICACERGARGAPDVFETAQGILGHDQQRTGRPHLRGGARDHGKTCPGLQGSGDEVMAIMPLALDRDEDLARPGGARVDGDRRSAPG